MSRISELNRESPLSICSSSLVLFPFKEKFNEVNKLANLVDSWLTSYKKFSTKRPLKTLLLV